MGKVPINCLIRDTGDIPASWRDFKLGDVQLDKQHFPYQIFHSSKVV